MDVHEQAVAQAAAMILTWGGDNSINEKIQNTSVLIMDELVLQETVKCC